MPHGIFLEFYSEIVSERLSHSAMHLKELGSNRLITLVFPQELAKDPKEIERHAEESKAWIQKGMATDAKK